MRLVLLFRLMIFSGGIHLRVNYTPAMVADGDIAIMTPFFLGMRAWVTGRGCRGFLLSDSTFGVVRFLWFRKKIWFGVGRRPTPSGGGGAASDLPRVVFQTWI